VFAWRSMPATSISISPMSAGAPSRSDPTDGASSARLLPVPQGGGSIEELASFLNLPSRNDFVLVVAWLLATLRTGGPYPALAISGEQGSAKTVLSKLLKDLVDPNVAPVRSLAREERDLVIAASNSHVLAFDNLSGLSHGLSDAFCRLATGASFGLRQLYTDADEVLFQAARPIILNGIDDVIGRSDLADRALFPTLPPIADRRRRVERQLWREFEVARPRILASLLDAAAHGLRNVAGIHLEELPRMADFALWATPETTAIDPGARPQTMLTVLTQKPLFSTGKLSDAHHLATCSRGRSAARRATNSLYRSAAPITPQSIASATSAHGGRPPVSTRSRPRASSGSTRE